MSLIEKIVSNIALISILLLVFCVGPSNERVIAASVPITNLIVTPFVSGNLKGYWEAHIRPDWLLIWLKNSTEKTITLIDTDTHSDLFK